MPDLDLQTRNHNHKMKSIQLTIDRTRWMASLEYAYLKVTSPTGKRIFIQKYKLHNLTDEQREIIHRLADERSPEAVAVTVAEMKLLYDASIQTK